MELFINTILLFLEILVINFCYNELFVATSIPNSTWCLLISLHPSLQSNNIKLKETIIGMKEKGHQKVNGTRLVLKFFSTQ